MAGKKGFSIGEVDEMMKRAIKEAAGEQRGYNGIYYFSIKNP